MNNNRKLLKYIITAFKGKLITRIYTCMYFFSLTYEPYLNVAKHNTVIVFNSPLP